MMNSFPNIYQLNIRGVECTNVTWPSSIDSQHLISFLDYLDTLTGYKVVMKVDNQMELLKQVYRSKIVNGESHACHLLLWMVSRQLSKAKLWEDSTESVLRIEKNAPNETKLAFLFGILQDNQGYQQSRIKEILPYENKVVKQITIHMYDVDTYEEIAVYLKSLLESSSHDHVQKLTLLGANLHGSALLSSMLSPQIKFSLVDFWNQHLYLYLVTYPQ